MSNLRLTSHYLFERLSESEQQGVKETLIVSEAVLKLLRDVLSARKDELVRNLTQTVENPYKTAGTVLSISEVDSLLNLLTPKDKT